MLPVAADSALMPSLLTLPDVFGTSYRAALAGGVNERTRVTVIGDGPVDLALAEAVADPPLLREELRLVVVVR